MKYILIYIYISINKTKTSFLSQKRAITTFLSRKFMITRLSIAFEDFLGSSIASQVMPPCLSHSFIAAAQIARHTATQVTARGQLFHLQLVGYIQGITIDLLVI